MACESYSLTYWSIGTHCGLRLTNRNGRFLNFSYWPTGVNRSTRTSYLQQIDPAQGWGSKNGERRAVSPIFVSNAAHRTGDSIWQCCRFLSSLRNERGSARPYVFESQKLVLMISIGCTTNQVNITPSALLAICVKLGVHSDFLDGVLRPSIWSKQSRGCFHTYNDKGEVEAISELFNRRCSFTNVPR
jgi:hypothetical protein